MLKKIRFWGFASMNPEYSSWSEEVLLLHGTRELTRLWIMPWVYDECVPDMQKFTGTVNRENVQPQQIMADGVWSDEGEEGLRNLH